MFASKNGTQTIDGKIVDLKLYRFFYYITESSKSLSRNYSKDGFLLVVSSNDYAGRILSVVTVSSVRISW